MPVPDRRIRKGRPRAATSARCRSIAGRDEASTSVGGSRVTCVGMPCACGSPKPSRRFWRKLPYGSGTAIETPSVTVPIAFSLLCACVSPWPV
ncbi:hypothetical protein GCM10010319_04290 [Streptomyces blastmyceticus]|uniref:Uncharacterized protein n=1 Tax=Streptomyces blastmyceticus TaxID=68180 RepID=A0ABP3G047_9ACTN